MLSNGNSFSDGQSMNLDPAQYPEPWWFRLMRPIQDRGQTWG